MPAQDHALPVVRIDAPASDDDDDSSDFRQRPYTPSVRTQRQSVAFELEDADEKQQPARQPVSLLRRLAKSLFDRYFAWVPKKLNWKSIKPVIRCSISAWLGLIVLLIVPAENVLGYAAFFVLIVAFMLPPSGTVIQNLEGLANLFFFTGLAWAWCNLGIFASGKVRSPVDPARIAEAQAKWAYLENDPAALQRHVIFDATYIEAKSAIVSLVFLCVGTGAVLWYKLRTQPSPATFPLVLSCILMDISLTTAALYPYPSYTTGLLFFLPMAVQGGISTVCSLLIFPESIAHSFQEKFSGVLDPLIVAYHSVEALFAESTSFDPVYSPQLLNERLDGWADKSQEIRGQLLQSLAGITPLRAQQRYLNVDFSYGRLSGGDLRDIFDLVAAIQTRSSGVSSFFDVVLTNARHLHLDSSVFSVHDPQSQPASRPASIRGDSDDESTSAGDRHSTLQDRPRHSLLGRRSGSPMRHNQSHVSLLDRLRKLQQPVGVYESQRYMDVEKAFSNDTEHILEQLDLLAEAALPLIRATLQALKAASNWLLVVNKDRHFPHVNKVKTESLEDATAGLQSALDDFHTARLQVVKPYRHIFDPAHPASADVDYSKLSYRGLFHAFLAQYHIIEFAEALLKLLRKFEEYDKTHTQRKFWYPHLWVLFDHFHKSHSEQHLTDGNEDHENDVAFTVDDELGEAKKRNPDHEPFNNIYLNALSRLAAIPDILMSRTSLYAVKAGVLTGLTALPQFIASSAGWYYYNRGIWATIMAQLTLAVYSGDTGIAWFGRCVASFWGCLLGMVAWYIGSGSGHGNPYGIAAVCAVAFPVATFFRIHFPGPVLTAVMTPVTFALVIGYSYVNGTQVQLTSATWGFDVAWRRFVCVLIGITAAWIFSYLPPVFSSKRALRESYSSVITAVGSMTCDIISHGNEHHHHITEGMENRRKLLLWRTKLSKLAARHGTASFEFSLRGRWPAARYGALRDSLQDALYLLAQLNHVMSQLDRPWRRALLHRTRLSDPAFLGDLLAIVTMCSNGLKSETALPQITPGPLVMRFRWGKTKGLNLPSDYASELPSMVTVDVLESENYMRYALGITTVYSLLARLDRLVIVCKTLLGESFHVSGIHFESSQER